MTRLASSHICSQTIRNQVKQSKIYVRKNQEISDKTNQWETLGLKTSKKSFDKIQVRKDKKWKINENKQNMGNIWGKWGIRYNLATVTSYM